ncbi:MAG: histidine kinase [Prevotella sp.]|nr:histidine kinase [Prevotella sp.]
MKIDKRIRDNIILYLILWVLAVVIFFFLLVSMEYDSLKECIADYTTEGVLFMIVFVMTFILISTLFTRIFFHLFKPQEKSTSRMILYSLLLLLTNFCVSVFMAHLANIGVYSVPFQELIKEIYLLSIIATFTSSIYANNTFQQLFVRQQEKNHQLERENAHQKEVNMQAMLMALKSQVDPHFLFNNFSILSELIEEDPKEAGMFLDNLSRVYRYKLVNMDHDLLSVENELKMLRAYVHLIEKRFGTSIQVNFPTSSHLADKHVPPLAIQLLVENAIKHNAHTTADPLVVDIRVEGDDIVVSNRIHPLVSRPEGTGVGLSNLMARYRLLSERQPEVIQTTERFTVKLPLL